MWNEIYPIITRYFVLFRQEMRGFHQNGKTAWIGYQNHRRHSKTEKKMFLTLTR